jgi:hypothetical protein
MSRFNIRQLLLFSSFCAVSFSVAGCSDSDGKDISALMTHLTANDGELSAERAKLGEISLRLDGNDSRLTDLSNKLAALEAAKAQAATDLSKTQDFAAISAVAGCYGRGHDAVVPAKDGDQSAALAILSSCFADDVQSEFIYFDNPVQAADQLAGLQALTNYIGSFWFNAGYHSARNTPGNVHVELVDPQHAKLLYSGTTPHFSVAEADTDPDPQSVARPGFIDNISASYTSDLQRDDDGVWRTTRFTINIKEVIRVPGTYWLAQ